MVAATMRTSARCLFITADALERLLLQHAQQFDLQIQRHFTYLVQEQGPAAGRLESSHSIFDRPGKGTPHMPKKFALVQFLGDRCTVDPYQWTLLAPAHPVNLLRDQLFAGARFPLDQHGRIGRSDHRDLPQRPACGRAGSDHCVGMASVALLLEIRVFTRHHALVDGGEEAAGIDRLGEELDGARLHCPYGRGYVAVACQEDDGNVNCGVDQLLLQIEAV